MTTAFTIRTEAATIDRLDRLAKALDRSRNYVANQALEAYLADQSWQIAAIEEGLADLERGDRIPHEQVMEEVREMISTQARKERD